MTTFTTKTQVDLDPEWVDNLLVTAFDGSLGGCWYWVNEDDDIETVQILKAGDQWRGVTFWFAETVSFGSAVPQAIGDWKLQPHLGDRGDGKVRWHVTLEKQHLDEAWAKIVNEGRKTETYRQLMESMHSGDLDVDAEGADYLVQIALFGEVVYG